MTDQPEKNSQQTPDAPERKRATGVVALVGALVLIAVAVGIFVVVTGMSGGGRGTHGMRGMHGMHGGHGMMGMHRGATTAPSTKSTTAGGAPNGAGLYAQNCTACHQAHGEGMASAFPPLAGSKWVVGTPDLPIRIVLNGLQGPVTVHGKSFNGVMPAFEGQFTDAELAAILTHVRTSWGNHASAITAKQVAKVRAKYKGRARSWTAAELKK